jgi:hypothetical protein
MKTEELWRQLEAEGVATGWSTRLARPEPNCRLLVALDHSTGSRALLLRADSVSIPPRREWPDCRGLEILLVSVGNDTFLGVRLRDAASKDVFTALTEQLASRVTVAPSESATVEEFISALRRWQLFLAAARGGLGVEAQRGLFGELYLLERVLVPALGPLLAVRGWMGPAGAHQDFQLGFASIEVKTTAASSQGIVRINSERQLDDTGAGKLFLHVVVVDDREVSAVGKMGSDTLASLVNKCRRSLDADQVARMMLEDGLLQLGWLDAHADRYDVRRITVRSQATFEVRPGFPRLLAQNLPVGVSEVVYGLDLAACQSFEVSTDTMLLRSTPEGE